MKTEIEVKFLDVDFDVLRETLSQLGAMCEQPMRLMRRAIIETPELRAKNGFIRIRDEGDKVTSTYKQVAARLGFDWGNAVFGKVTSAYQIQYPQGNARGLVGIPFITFVPPIISGQKPAVS